MSPSGEAQQLPLFYCQKSEKIQKRSQDGRNFKSRRGDGQRISYSNVLKNIGIAN